MAFQLVSNLPEYMISKVQKIFNNKEQAFNFQKVCTLAGMQDACIKANLKKLSSLATKHTAYIVILRSYVWALGSAWSENSKNAERRYCTRMVPIVGGIQYVIP